jgi:hypothetical protein
MRLFRESAMFAVDVLVERRVRLGQNSAIEFPVALTVSGTNQLCHSGRRRTHRELRRSFGHLWLRRTRYPSARLCRHDS